MTTNLVLLGFLSVSFMVRNGAAWEHQNRQPLPHATTREEMSCETTEPNGQTPPGESWSPGLHGNGGLWTSLWPNGTVVFEPRGSGFVLEDGSLQMKFPWWRGVRGPLQIEGRRIDAPAAPLRAYIPCCYGDSGFQATGLIFPTPGCWEVTGRVGGVSLTFVTRVVKIGEGPVRRGFDRPGSRLKR